MIETLLDNKSRRQFSLFREIFVISESDQRKGKQILLCFYTVFVLTHSIAMVSLYTHWKYLKLMFSGGVERDQWHEAVCWSLFLIKLQPWRPEPFSKRDSNAGVFLWNCKIFRKSFFHRTPPATSFDSCHIFSMTLIFSG